MKQFARSLFALAALVAFPAISFASPVYNLGNTCPTTAQMGPYTNQYYVTDAIACVFETVSSGPAGNIDGSTAEAALYLGALGGWTGLGQDEPPDGGTNDIAAFTYSGTTSGLFTVGAPLTTTYNQFAVGIKDGGSPKWAIFLLPVGDFSSNWGIIGGGSLSHFTLYGRSSPTTRCVNLPCTPQGDDPPSVPDGGATLAMLGVAMAGLGYARRKFAA